MMHGRAIAACAGGSALLTLPTTDLLAAWDARVGVTDAGAGAVSAWTDYHGGFAVIQGTEGKRPVITSGVVGGQPAVVFDGTSDALVDASPSVVSTGTGHTTYIVLNLESVASAPTLTDSWLGRCMNRVDAASNMGIFNGGLVPIGAISTGAQVLTYSLASANTVTGYSGSTLIGTSAATFFQLGNAFSIGSNALGSGGYADAGFAAVFIYNEAHDATARAAVWAYIAQEWGV